MLFLENSPLNEHSTMRLGGKARYLCTVESENDLAEALRFAQEKDLKTVVVGDGSNIVWSDDGFDGLVIVNAIKKLEFMEDEVLIGAGENWDDAVKTTINHGLYGLEYLSLIPGTSGATPVQNVGAYGAEIKDYLIDLKAYDTKTSEYVFLNNEQCKFGYRSSIFNTTDKDRYIITEIKLKLSKNNPKPPFYDSLQKYLDQNDIVNPTSADIRDAVIEIRSSKLPDPRFIANNGSFFANPIVSIDEFERLEKEFPKIVAWDHPKGKKLAAGWLLEQAGFKDFHDKNTGMATWKKQALVMINENAKSTSDLIKFRDMIIDGIKAKFGVELKQEPELK